MLCAASAAGLPLPPMIIYSKSFPGGQYCFDWPYDAFYAKSESGWIGSELFLKWMREIFLKHVVIRQFCCLLMGTSPLDVAVFKSLKDNYSKQ